MGALCEVLHIRPWEHELLTVEDLDAAIEYIDELDKRMRDAAGR